MAALALVLSLGAPRAAEPKEAQAKPPPETAYGVDQLKYDAAFMARRPFTLGKRGRRKAYAIAGATALLYAFRDEIRNEVQDHQSPGRTRFLDGVRTMGKGAFAPTLALIAYGTSLGTGNARERETAVLLLESMGYSAAVAYGGSFVLATERPVNGDSIGFLDTDGRGVSLDAALAASVIPPLRRQYLRVRPEDGPHRRFWKRTATVALYGGAVLTGYQRLNADQHWAPDVFLGLAGGLGVGKTLCDAHDEARDKRLRLEVGMTPGGAGLVLRFEPRGSR